MKKIICIILACCLILGTMSSCGKHINNISGGASDNSSNGGIKVVTTIFPEYDWVRELANGNDNIDITMLLDKGVDLHSFQPTADDIVKISTCDMFIYVGGESDKWVNDALAEATNKDMVVLNLMDILGENIKEEEIVEGMEAEEEEDDAEEEIEEIEYDEHVWLSLRNARVICQNITEGLIKVDSENKELYENNLSNYVDELVRLDEEYKEAVDNANIKTLVFGDRFPFRYLVDDYGLDYYAAFVGCSAESEASFETIMFLAGKIDELGLNSIVKLEDSDGRIAETIIQNAGNKDVQIVSFDSMQSKTKSDVLDGVTYISVMEDNLLALREALK